MLFVDGGNDRVFVGTTTKTVPGAQIAVISADSVTSTTNWQLAIEGSDDAGILFIEDGSKRGTCGFDTGISQVFLGDNDGDNRWAVSSSSNAIYGYTGGTVALTINSSQDLTIAGDLVVSGTGPHAVGIAAADYIAWVQGGAFTSGGATTRAGAFVVRTVLTGADGDTAVQCAIGAGSTWGTGITTQANSETIGVVATAHFSDPDITKGTDTVTVASTVYIADAPTEGETNAALYVAAGASQLMGDVGIGTAPSNRLHVKETGMTGWLAKFEGNYSSSSDVVIEMGYSGSGNQNSGMNISMDYATGTSDYVLNCASGGTSRFKVNAGGLVHVAGELTAGTKTFRIDHPLADKKDTHQLVHSCIEAPKADLIYRGTANLSSGVAQVDLDEAAGMSAGTWELLCRDPQVWLQNDSGWSGVRGSVEGNILTIECKDTVSDDTVSWMVVAERQDESIKGQDATDNEGRLIVEPEKEDV
jgi:hypothetical protein